MTKDQLIQKISNYAPYDATEQGHKDAVLQLLNGTDECFERHNFPGHMTAGAWVLSKDKQRVLFTHHKFLNRWLQLGGHVDGEIDIIQAALREAQEESGIEDVVPLSLDIFDIDAHGIPENPKKNEPAHMHYDLAFLFHAQNDNFVISDESNDLKWFTVEDVQTLNATGSKARMLKKWQAYLERN
jgi:8-oxo-dGTP pyrophosphatase MutT (NUDIX family)